MSLNGGRFQRQSRADVRVFRGTLLLTTYQTPVATAAVRPSPSTATGAGAGTVPRCDERYSRGRAARTRPLPNPFSTRRFGRLTGSDHRDDLGGLDAFRRRALGKLNV